MKLLLFISKVFSCSTLKSGLNISAYQTFILGKFNDKKYSA